MDAIRDERTKLNRKGLTPRVCDQQPEFFGRTRGQPPSSKRQQPPHQSGYTCRMRFPEGREGNRSAESPEAKDP